MFVSSIFELLLLSSSFFFGFVQVESNFCNDLDDPDLQKNAEANFFEDDPNSATTATTATTASTTETAAETTAETAAETTLETILGMSPTVIKVEIWWWKYSDEWNLRFYHVLSIYVEIEGFASWNCIAKLNPSTLVQLCQLWTPDSLD